MQQSLVFLWFFAAVLAAYNGLPQVTVEPSVSTMISQDVQSLDSKYTMLSFLSEYTNLPYTAVSAQALMDYFFWYTYIAEVYSIGTKYLTELKLPKYDPELFYTPTTRSYETGSYLYVPIGNGTNSGTNVLNGSRPIASSSTSDNMAGTHPSYYAAGGLAGLLALALM